MSGYRLGAVVYAPKVEQIWQEFGAWFADQGLPLDVHYFDRYDDQVDALLADELDVAWNTNLAHVEVLRRVPEAARALAMRDTDLGWQSVIVADTGRSLRTVADLRGRRVGFGDADSPQAHILPVHALGEQGIDVERDWIVSRLDRDLGKHGDTGGAELAQLARVRAGELDACVVSSVTLDAVGRLGDASQLVEVWRSPPFHHCCFSVVRDHPQHERFVPLLFSMDASDPRLCEPMELEYVNRWVTFDPTGYAQLIAAVEAGPVVVGSAPDVAA
jgi:ABC-type phosphate/phosphonate transport system substrate-binding protein